MMRRPAFASDADDLAPRLRAIDVAEIAAGTGRDPLAVLRAGVESGAEAAVDDGRVVALFGCANGAPWLLGSPEIARKPWALLRPARAVVAEWLAEHGMLLNYVYAKHRQSVRWLTWLGFTVEPPRPLGVRGELFSPFWMRADV